MRVLVEDIKKRSVAVFEKAGLNTEDAKIITEVLLETEMRGVFTHGFMRLERYVNCIKKGGIKPLFFYLYLYIYTYFYFSKKLSYIIYSCTFTK